MIELPFLAEDTPFPNIDTALDEPNGLLAFGGDRSVRRLYFAYSQGIFPWFNEGEPILWWSPSPRAVIELEHFHCSSSLRKLVRQQRYTVTMNHAFVDVINACATIPRRDLQALDEDAATWITMDMRKAYIQLHLSGLAHSVEVWEGSELVGGFYGVAIGKVFCGESMFHKKSNTSKLALYALVEHMKQHDMAFIDCQLPTEHLASLGAASISRESFIRRLHGANMTLDEKGQLSESYRELWCKRTLSTV